MERINNLYVIPEDVFFKLEEKFIKLANKAKKLGMTPPTYKIIHEQIRAIQVEGRKRMINYLYVTIEGERPTLDGWDFIGVIDHIKDGETYTNIISAVPGESIPAAYRDAEPTCDHCGTNRRRNETFVCRNDSGEYKRVGRNCLADFIGTSDINDVLSYMNLFISLDGILQVAEEERGESNHYLGIDEIIGTTIKVIKKFGWVSKAAAADSGRDSTATIVSILLWSDYNYIKEDRPELLDCCRRLTQEEQEQVASAIEWTRGIDPQIDNDYLYNLYAVARNEYIHKQHLGITVSLYVAYQKSLIKADEATQSQHVGSIGGKYLFKDMSVIRIGRGIGGAYGMSWPVSFRDKKGNVYTWFSSNVPKFIEDALDKQTSIDVIGTVKDHVAFRGIAQTNLTRVVAPTKTNVRKLMIIE